MRGPCHRQRNNGDWSRSRPDGDVCRCRRTCVGACVCQSVRCCGQWAIGLIIDRGNFPPNGNGNGGWCNMTGCWIPTAATIFSPQPAQESSNLPEPLLVMVIFSWGYQWEKLPFLPQHSATARPVIKPVSQAVSYMLVRCVCIGLVQVCLLEVLRSLCGSYSEDLLSREAAAGIWTPAPCLESPLCRAFLRDLCQ